MLEAIKWAAAGTGFTFLMTTLGAALVFFFRGELKMGVQRMFLGFAAGVMIAASVWSLLIPAIEQAEEQGMIGWIPAAGGLILGGLFLFGLDRLIPHLHSVSGAMEGDGDAFKRTTMLLLAVTLHNIPEGMAVGVAFAVFAQTGEQAALSAALALAIGIGIQNFPEGAAISLPLRKEGVGVGKSFALGSLSGAVEPVFGILTVFIVGSVTAILPWFLSFAAGAMLYVVVEELIPEAQLGEHSNIGTVSVMAGFLVMMILDVALG